MKICAFCGTKCDDSVLICSSCGAGEFSHICANCGNVYTKGNFCPNCGVRSGTKAKKCPQCGTEYFSNACPNCGYTPARPVQTQPPQPQPQTQTQTFTDSTVNSYEDKNKWLALFLCVFFGYMGAHKFYEGKIGMGLLYIFTMGLFCIGWVIDIFLILAKPTMYKP